MPQTIQTCLAQEDSGATIRDILEKYDLEHVKPSTFAWKVCAAGLRRTSYCRSAWLVAGGCVVEGLNVVYLVTGARTDQVTYWCRCRTELDPLKVFHAGALVYRGMFFNCSEYAPTMLP